MYVLMLDAPCRAAMLSLALTWVGPTGSLEDAEFLKEAREVLELSEEEVKEFFVGEAIPIQGQEGRSFRVYSEAAKKPRPINISDVFEAEFERLWGKMKGEHKLPMADPSILLRLYEAWMKRKPTDSK